MSLKGRGIENVKITRVASQSALEAALETCEGEEHWGTCKDDDGMVRTALRIGYDKNGHEIPLELLWCTESRIKDVKALANMVTDDLFERKLEQLVRKFDRDYKSKKERGKYNERDSRI